MNDAPELVDNQHFHKYCSIKVRCLVLESREVAHRCSFMFQNQHAAGWGLQVDPAIAWNPQVTAGMGVPHHVRQLHLSMHRYLEGAGLPRTPPGAGPCLRHRQQN